MNPNLGMPMPQIGLAQSLPGSRMSVARPHDPKAVQPMGQQGGGIDWMAMLPMMQGLFQQQNQQQGGQQMPQQSLMMPNMNVPQFQMGPLAGLFGLHRGV